MNIEFFKPVEITVRWRLMAGRIKIEGMNQFGL
jgi:hypothetical protein